MSTDNARFVQITCGNDGTLYALDSQGQVWWCHAQNMKSKTSDPIFSWRRLNMRGINQEHDALYKLPPEEVPGNDRPSDAA